MSALSCVASATEVTLYGVIDTGFTYQHTEGGDDSFAMTSGNYAGPRFGFKGTEDLGDNLTLGFVLEAGFNSDTGAQGEDGKILNRDRRFISRATGYARFRSCRRLFVRYELSVLVLGFRAV